MVTLGKLPEGVRQAYKIKAAHSMDGQLYFIKFFKVGYYFAEPRKDEK